MEALEGTPVGDPDELIKTQNELSKLRNKYQNLYQTLDMFSQILSEKFLGRM